MKRLPGLVYDGQHKRAVLDGYVSGTKGKVRRQRTIENVTYDQALSASKHFRAELQSGRALVGRMTLRAFLDRDFALIAAGLQDSTRKTHRSLIDRHLLRFFGETYLDAITTVRVMDFATDMRNRKLSPSYINDAVRLLKSLLRQAVERDVIGEYPIKKKIPKEKEPPLRLELKPAERARLFATFDDEAGFRRYFDEHQDPVGASERFDEARRFGRGRRGDSTATGAYFARYRELREFFIVGVETGLRNRSDLRNLRWSDVDFASGFIRLTMQKTLCEVVVPLSGACRAALLACRAKPVLSEYVFVDETGQRFSPTRIKRTFARAKKLAGIQRRLRLHDLRHSFGCRLASGGVSLQIIAKALGHTTTKMAERYARPSEEAMRAITSALDADALDSVSMGSDFSVPATDTVAPLHAGRKTR
jgi:integrase